MKKYILTITYNFDSDYVSKAFDTEEAAIQELNRYLSEEVETIRRESEYEPSVIMWNNTDITLVYAEGYDDGLNENYRKDYPMEDCAEYRIIEVEI